MPNPELVVLSRERVECYEPQGVEVCISITDPEAADVQLSSRFAAVLRLQFNDVLAAGAPTDVLFDEEHARRIIAFVKQWPLAERIVVHCMAGVSRSPGVALGLCDLYGWPAAEIEQAKPSWNSLVRRVLAAAAAGS
jgi:predicted protein tyrosine phosphatase